MTRELSTVERDRLQAITAGAATNRRNPDPIGRITEILEAFPNALVQIDVVVPADAWDRISLHTSEYEHSRWKRELVNGQVHVDWFRQADEKAAA